MTDPAVLDQFHRPAYPDADLLKPALPSAAGEHVPDSDRKNLPYRLHSLCFLHAFPSLRASAAGRISFSHGALFPAMFYSMMRHLIL